MRVHRATEPVSGAERRAGAPSPLQRGCPPERRPSRATGAQGRVGRPASNGSEGKYESGHEHSLRKCFQARDCGGDATR